MYVLLESVTPKTRPQILCKGSVVDAMLLASGWEVGLPWRWLSQGPLGTTDPFSSNNVLNSTTSRKISLIPLKINILS